MARLAEVVSKGICAGAGGGGGCAPQRKVSIEDVGIETKGGGRSGGVRVVVGWVARAIAALTFARAISGVI